MLDLVGRVIDGRYRLDRLVGEGGFGAVFQAEHLALGSSVAIKILKSEGGDTFGVDTDLARQLTDEVGLLSRLRHPNVVAALDAGMLPAESGAPARPYIVLEWSAGVTLKDWLFRRIGPGAGLPLAEVWAIIEPLGAAVAHAHRLGIVHRDIKPANVMMEERDGGAGLVPRIIDFGIGKLAEPLEAPSTGATVTASQAIAFTPAYAAPEQVLGMRTGTWTDVHALALLFVELATGRPPYGTDHAESRLAAVSPERPSAARFGVDVGAFGPPIALALALRPPERPTIHALLGDLGAAAKSLGLPQAALHPPDASTRAFVVGHGVSADASTIADGPRSTSPPESTAAPSRTAFHPASTATATPRPRTVMRRVALAAASVAVLGAGALGTRRLLTPRALGELDQRALVERVAAIATIRGASEAPRLVYVAFTKDSRDGDLTLMRVATNEVLVSRAQLQSTLRLIVARPGGTRQQIAAATDFEWLLYVACTDRAISEIVLAAATEHVEAVRIEVPDPGPEAPPAPRGPTRLADLDAGTLIAALSKSGEVLDILAIAEVGTVVAATLTEPGSREPSQLQLFRFPMRDAVESELARTRGLGDPFTYAVDDTTLLLVRGAARHRDPAFVRNVLDGIPLEVRTWAP